jgi:hypothetical protein
MLGFDGAFEGLFALTIVILFGFWMGAKMKKKTFMEFYNDTMDGFFGKSEAIEMDNPLKRFKRKEVMMVR